MDPDGLSSVRQGRENSVHAAYPPPHPQTFPLKPAIAEARRGMTHDEPELRRKSNRGGTSSGLQEEARKLQFSLTRVIKTDSHQPSGCIYRVDVLT